MRTVELKWTLTLVSLFVILKCGCGVRIGSYCDTVPHLCDRVKCEPPAECPHGIVLQGGGICGCCDVCLQYRGYNQSCTGDTPLPVKIPPGKTAQCIEFDTCQPGYHCGDKKLCTTFPTKQASANSYCPSLEYESMTSDWEVPPDCNPYGYFEYKRCKGRDNPRCFCVDEDGDTIFGRIGQKDVNATCYCSRAVADLKIVSNNTDIPNVRCTQTGDYATLQCWDDLCFCVNMTTLKILSNAVPIAGVTALPCYDSASYTTTYYQTCEREMLKLNKLFKDFAKKGISTIILDVPDCDPDGTYAQIQWDVKRWICSDRNGKQINNYVVTTFEDREQMLCNCARDEWYPDGLPPSQPPDCNLYGNYNTATPKCFNDMCYCIDSDGQRRTDDFPNDKKKPDCTQSRIRTFNGRSHRNYAPEINS